MILQDLLFPCYQFFLSLRWLLKMILILLKESLHDEEFYSNQWPNIPAVFKLKPPPGPNCAGMEAATRFFCTSDSVFRQNAAEEKVVDSHVQQIVGPCQKKMNCWY